MIYILLKFEASIWNDFLFIRMIVEYSLFLNVLFCIIIDKNDMILMLKTCFRKLIIILKPYVLRPLVDRTWGWLFVLLSLPHPPWMVFFSLQDGRKQKEQDEKQQALALDAANLELLHLEEQQFQEYATKVRNSRVILDRNQAWTRTMPAWYTTLTYMYKLGIVLSGTTINCK